MPLTEKVTFKAKLQKGNRVQVPKLIRWQFKLETDQVLKISVKPINMWVSGELFYVKMAKDGRVLIPKLILVLMQDEKTSVEDFVLNVTLEPA